MIRPLDAAARAGPWGVQARVLIVDDEPPNVALLQRLLGRAGYANVIAVTDPNMAVERLRAGEADLLILDLHMPRVDGFQILKFLRELEPERGYMPIIVLTADVDRGALRRALALGAHDYLTKPFEAEEVLLRVRNLLETRRLHLRLREHVVSLEHTVAERTGELQESRSERDFVTETLQRLSSLPTVEETAKAILGELRRIPEVQSALILSFLPHGSAIVLAVDVPLPIRLAPGDALVPARAAYLYERASQGAWIEPWRVRPEDGEYGRNVAEAGITAAAYLPITEGRLSGLLVVAGNGADATDALARRLPLLQDYAAITRVLLVPMLASHRQLEELRAEVRAVTDARALHSVFQPIHDLEQGVVVGYEALTRFSDGTPPNRRFAEAEEVGVGLELEEATAASAIEASRRLPEAAWMSVNVSPKMITSDGRLQHLLHGLRRDIVLEITEHVAIDRYEPIRTAVGRLGSGIRLAIDDAGAGYASLRHILELKPDFVKLDIGLVRGIEADSARQALVVGMRYFAMNTGCALIAEGIETEAELDMLKSLSVKFGQGYLLGRPLPPDELHT